MVSIYLKKVVRQYRNGGIQAVRAGVQRYLETQGISTFSQVLKRRNKRRPAEHLGFVLEYPETLPLSPPRQPFNPNLMKIHWVIPDFVPGAGGHMSIFRIAGYLESFGHEVTIWINGNTIHGLGERARQVINEHFVPFNGEVRILAGNQNELIGDAVIATDRWTAYPVRSVCRVRRRYYFVQDFEPSFYPMGTDYLLTENTYGFGYTCITAGNWLKSLLERKYGLKAYAFSLACDTDIYRCDAAALPKAKRIAFYAREATPRRAVDLAYLAFELLARKHQDLHVDFFGWDIGNLDVPYSYRNYGILRPAELCKLYQQATVGVVFSCTNYSLISLEMMGCGLPVVELDMESTRADFDSESIILAKPEPCSIAAAIDQMLTDPSHRKWMREKGLSYVRRFNWEKSARMVEDALRDALC